MPAAATDARVMVNLRAHCGSTTCELDGRGKNLSPVTKRGGGVELVLLEADRYLSHGPDAGVMAFLRLNQLIGNRALGVERIRDRSVDGDLGSG